MTSSLLVFFFFFVLSSHLFLEDVQCHPLESPSTSSPPDVCFKKIDKMKHVLENLKLEQRRTGNVTIANMEIFYEMCTDTTNCIESIQLPGLLKGLMNLGTVFLRSACEDYGFRVGPFSKCIERIRFDVTTLKNTTIGGADERKKCELTEQELAELEQVVREQCEPEAVEDMRKNEHRVRALLCDGATR